jgi:hypothetical protein
LGTLLAPRAFFSVLRWRTDPTRDEARNVAVVLVNEDGTLGGVRSAPLSQVSSRLHDQGLLDATLVALERRFDGESKPTLSDLDAMRLQLQRSLYLTEPQPVAVSDVDATLDALYRAYAAPRNAGSKVATKGHLLDQTVVALRRRGWMLKRGEYVGSFIFDLVAASPEPLLIECLSFASGAASLVSVEQDAGHFLYGLRRLSLKGLAIVQEPPADARQSAVDSFNRVRSWLADDDVNVMNPSDIAWRPEQPKLLS